VLFECLTGDRPYGDGGVEQQVAGHLAIPPPRPSQAQSAVSPEFDAVIAKGMAKNPDDRYQSTMELARAARTALAPSIHQQLTAPGPPEQPTRPVPLGANQFRGPAAPMRPTAAPPLSQPMPAFPPPARRSSRRAAVIVAALVSVVAVAAGIFAVVKMTNQPEEKANAGTATGAQETTNSKNPGPIDGTFTAVWPEDRYSRQTLRRHDDERTV
jgi:serine/threonine-protein kinase